MLKLLKEMQKNEIFKLIPSDIDLDSIINRAYTEQDVKIHLQEIQDYIKRLDMELTLKYNVPIANYLSDFYDKFYYELFDIAFTREEIEKGTVYQKQITFGSAGIGRLGLSSDESIKFQLDERKLLKLANHYYIKLKENPRYDNKYFYIPFEHLKTIFTTDNNKILKDSVVDLCKRISAKQVYWALNDTKYKKLKKEKLDIGKNIPLLDLTIIYLPREHQKGINGTSYAIKGILCKVTNFMKMRYEIKQIANFFPVSCLKRNYLEFVIAEKIIYQLNILNTNNIRNEKIITNHKRLSVNARKTVEQRIKSSYEKSLGDLANEIYVYKNNEQHSSNYLYEILNKSNSKRQILEFLTAVRNVLETISNSPNSPYGTSFIIRNKIIMFDDDNANVKTIEDIYQEVLKIVDKFETRGRFKSILRDGELKLRVNIVV